MSAPSIAIILPLREGFSPQAFGAVSLSVRDFTLHSRWREASHVLGMRNEAPYEGIHYQALAVKRHWYEPNTRAYVRAIVARLHSLRPSLIEVHNRPLLVRKLAGNVQAPIALHLHNDPQEMKAAKTPAARAKLLQQCAAIYCISHWVKSRFLQGLTEGHEKVHTIHSGVAIPPPPPAKKPYIVYVGRMTPNKGALEYAQALAQVLPQHLDWQGYMIGGRRHSVSTKLSTYEKDILQVIDHVGPNAHFEGFYPFDKTQQMFRDAAIVVIPSLWEEPFGRTGIEAIAQGCAVITSGRGGLREIVADTGVILQEVTGNTIADSIQALITNPLTLSALQQAAYARAQQFDIATCTARLDAVRDAIISAQTKGYAHAA